MQCCSLPSLPRNILFYFFSLFVLRSLKKKKKKLVRVPQISTFCQFFERLYSKRKGTDRICSFKRRRSCVAWLTGPRLRFVNLQWSVDTNSTKVQDSFPSNSAQNKSFLWIFPGLQNCRDSKRLSTCPMFGLKRRQLAAFPHYSHLMHFWGQRTQQVETERCLIRDKLKCTFSAEL